MVKRRGVRNGNTDSPMIRMTRNPIIVKSNNRIYLPFLNVDSYYLFYRTRFPPDLRVVW